MTEKKYIRKPSPVDEAQDPDAVTISVIRAAGKLAIQLGRMVPNADTDLRIALSCAIGLCSTATSVAMVDTQLARTLYSQARRLSNVRSVK